MVTTNVTATYEGPAASEVEQARRYLEEARDRTFLATDGLSEAQWNYRPASGGWPVAGIVEHMVLIQDFILGPIAQALASSPELSSAEPETIDAIIKTKIPDRSRKFQAPESVHPAGRWTPSESLNRLSANTLRLIERLESTPALRQHSVPSPPLNAVTNGEHKLMDGYQSILAAAAHTHRHTQQILEVKAEPGFPVS
jgi:hypothetical protein